MLAPAKQGFQVSYFDSEGAEQRGPLTALVQVAFESAPPVRGFPSYHRQRNYPGLWWSATLGRHVGYESWLERDQAMLLDFDPRVVGFASQPFWLLWDDGARGRAHAPDWFVRLDDGTGVVIDCRPATRMRPLDQAAFAATSCACTQAGWRYRLVHEHDPVVVGNVRWLAGYRHPRPHDAQVTAALAKAFAQPRGLLDGASSVGEPVAVLPTCYHLLWRGVLTADLTVPLHDRTVVRAAGAGA